MAFQQGFLYLITTLFSILTYVLVFRFLFTLLAKNYRNDINGTITRATEPLLKPLRVVLPTVKKVDFALLAVIFSLHVIQYLLIMTLFMFARMPIVQVFISSAFTVILQMSNVVSFSIIVLVVMSWLSPGSYNPITDAAYYLSDWLLRPLRAALPVMGGIDLSPMLAIIGIQFINIVFIRPFI